MLKEGNFRRLWLAITVSGTSSHVTLLAVPILAIASLGADAAELGQLMAAQLLPMLLITPVAGALVDSFPARALNAICDLARGLLLLLIPLLAVLDQLSINWLYVIGVALGIFKSLGDVAHHTLLPRIVEPDRLIPGNAAINASWSVTDVAGPGLAGLLIQALTAPIAIVLDAVGFIVSGALIATLKTRTTARTSTGQSWPRMIGEGFAFLWRDRPLLMLGISGGIANLFISAYMTLFVLYAVTALGLGAGLIGGLYALGAVGGVIGAAVSARIAARITQVGAMVLGNVTVGTGMVIVAAAALPDGPVRLVCLVIGVGCYAWGLGVYNVHSMSIRQAASPANMLGRVTAGYRLLSHGTLPLGALLGGYAATLLGTGPTIAIAGVALIVWMAVAMTTPFNQLNNAARASAEPATV